uniref:Uncharacterized protein n=1 Tax=Anguilla anguilla TaxID=7936 RepID=A0A0E9WMZ1_ANGAN
MTVQFFLSLCLFRLLSLPVYLPLYFYPSSSTLLLTIAIPLSCFSSAHSLSPAVLFV